jgi:hypothetical protein
MVCRVLAASVLNTPDWIRTSNLRFRRPMLYPVELRVRTSIVPRRMPLHHVRGTPSRYFILTDLSQGDKTV